MSITGEVMMDKRWVDYLTYAGPLIGILFIAQRISDYQAGIAIEESTSSIIFDALITLALLSSPFFIRSWQFMHAGLKARQRSQSVHNSVQNTLTGNNTHKITTSDEARSGQEAELFNCFSQVAALHHLLVELTVVDSTHRYFNVGKQSAKRLSVVVSSQTLKKMSAAELGRLLSETIIFHELNTEGMFNKPEDAFPSNNTFVPMNIDTSYVLACWLFFQARFLLKKADSLLGLNFGTSFNQRCDAFHKRFAEENQHWLTAQ